jgi:hypothetical protein
MDDREWVVHLIDEMKSRLTEINPILLTYLGAFQGVSTQATVFVFREPTISVIVFRSSKEQPDPIVDIRDSIPFSDGLDALPSLWQRDASTLVPDGRVIDQQQVSASVESMASVYERIFKYFFVSVGLILTRQIAGFLTKLFQSGISVLVSYGEPRSINAKQLIDNLANLLAGPYPSTQYFAHTGYDRTAYFGRLPVGVSLGGEAQVSFKEEVTQDWKEADVIRMTGQRYSERIGGIDVVFFSAGAVAVDTSQPNKALQLINLFFAALSRGGTKCAQITEVELGRITVNGCGMAQSWSIQPDHVRTRLFGLELITEAQLAEAFRLCHLAVKDDQICSLLRLNHSAFVHVINGEYLQAFVLSWTIIELSIVRKWHRFIDRHTGNSERQSKLKGRRDIVADVIIEVIALGGDLEDATYLKLQTTRKIRNDVIHNGKIPNRQDSMDCTILAASLLSDELAVMSQPRGA